MAGAAAIDPQATTNAINPRDEVARRLAVGFIPVFVVKDGARLEPLSPAVATIILLAHGRMMRPL
jgi:hypothetical protein